VSLINKKGGNPAANKSICKSWADGSRVSTFCFQFGFISGRRITIELCANHQHFFINLASGSRGGRKTIPQPSQIPARKRCDRSLIGRPLDIHL
jgi:hypothetical protein